MLAYAENLKLNTMRVRYSACSIHCLINASFSYAAFTLLSGSVEYVTDLFVEKNLDELPREATELLLSSERPLVVSLAKYMRTSDRSSATVQNKGRISSRKSIMKSKATVSGQFIDQLRQLRYKIDRTNPHYIRCVKPNNNFIANEFDLALVLSQLRYAGVLEAIRVSRAGFPQRFSMPYFVDRYRFLLGKNIVTGDLLAIKQACSAIIKSVSVRILSSQQTQQTSDFITEGYVYLNIFFLFSF